MPEDRTRLTAHQIFAAVLESGRDELGRSSTSLAFSGLTAGLVMGLTVLGVALAHVSLGTEGVGRIVAGFLYPVGFTAAIIGRAQLFTENTLYPIVLVLDERGHVGNTARLWAIVFSTNQAGSLLFAGLAVWTGALEPAVVDEVIAYGRAAVARGTMDLFWSAVLGGWLIALVAWIVTGSSGTAGQILVIWAFTAIVGLADLSHSVASSAGVLAWVIDGETWLGYFGWLAPVTLGNILGGVTMVSLLNYGQVRAEVEEGRGGRSSADGRVRGRPRSEKR